MPRKKKKAGFTILEMLLMVVIIGVSLVAIIVSLSNGMTFMQKTREKTIAINLAREGIEAVYQMRDTNRYRRAGQKESCRLKKNPLADQQEDGNCSNDDRMGSGNYILATTVVSGQQYFLLTGGNFQALNLSNGIDSGDNLKFSLCKGENGIRSGCNSPVSNEGKFFRSIRGIGLFDKTVAIAGGEFTGCTKGTDFNCGGAEAKEYRFCSKVAYIGKGRGEVELCGLLTNFQKK